MKNNNEVLLRVESLSQHFGKLKAVDKVSFDIHKGEVFGLVGESGCGKTTIGRTVIKLYDATGGNVYFKGKRIVAGTLEYKQNIENCQKELKTKLKELKENGASADEINSEKAKAAEYIAEQKKEIKRAKFDQKNCDKQYSLERQQQVHAQYKQLISAETDPEKKHALEKELQAAIYDAEEGSILFGRPLFVNSSKFFTQPWVNGGHIAECFSSGWDLTDCWISEH